MTVSKEMPRYVCHKEVWALKISDIVEGGSNDSFAGLVFENKDYSDIYVSADWFYSKKPEIGGYYVVYQDGYASYSPALAFEQGYALAATAKEG